MKRPRISDAERVELARSARASLVACRAALAADGLVERERRRTRETWSGPLLELLATARATKTPRWLDAQREWNSCVQAWWALAHSLEYVARAEARHYFAHQAGLGVDDLEAYAMMGLFRAAQTWDPDAEGSAGFRRYGGRGARTGIRAVLRDTGQDVDLPANDLELLAELRHELDRLEARGYPHNLFAAARAVGCTFAKARALMVAVSRAARLDKPVHDSEGAICTTAVESLAEIPEEGLEEMEARIDRLRLERLLAANGWTIDVRRARRRRSRRASEVA